MEQPSIDLSIEDFSPRGFGLATAGKSQIEVAHALPGDRVRVDLRRRSRRVQKGRLLELLTPSPHRITPRCQHASICGGCCWQSMNYAAQVQFKQESICRTFRDLIHAGVDFRPLITCEDPWSYRNKMEFSFSENRAGTRFLGLMIAHAEPYVYNVEHCEIAPAWMSECLSRVRAWWEPSGLLAYHPPQDRGTLRYLTLREGIRTQQKMAILNVSGNPEFAPSKMQLESFVQAIGDSIGTFLRIHQTKKGVPTRFYEMHLAGADHIIETLHLKTGDLHFKISPASFFQPNTRQAEKLYDAAIQHLDGASMVYDLYCGTGTLGMAASTRAQRVIGIELSPEAILDAEENAKRNQISNIQFYQGDVGATLTRLQSGADFCRPDAVIVDPPRAGLDALAIHHLKTLLPKKIVYVSCNPATQADNIRELVSAGYTLTLMQGVDQFPHTAHIENIAVLKSACL